MEVIRIDFKQMTVSSLLEIITLWPAFPAGAEVIGTTLYHTTIKQAELTPSKDENNIQCSYASFQCNTLYIQSTFIC